MANISQNTPKDVFLHLLNILTFYLSVIAFITLYIQYVSAIFPDPLTFYYTGIANSVRLFISILVVALPVYLLTSWLLAKDLSENPEKRELELRKWLIYLTLFISAVTIIIDLITIFYNFLSGELTTQFFLKTLVVLLAAGAVFGYYIWELRRRDKGVSKVPKILAWTIALAAAASIILSFFIIGTPAEQRSRRFDERRVNDLQILQNQIVNHWAQKNVLPNNLGDMEDSISGFTIPADPESGAAYEYNIKGDLTFELCANFKTSTKGSKISSIAPNRYFFEPFPGSRQSWEHKAERNCFERTIDPELYRSGQDGIKSPLPLD